jgi:ElaB/YqjD/DUF883 family membrane-anchored ribosome-binding protein
VSDLEDARAAAAAARADLKATFHELEERLRPSNLAGDAIDSIKRKGGEVAGEAVEAVRSRPITASAVAAGIGALIGARLFRRKSRKGDAS